MRVLIVTALITAVIGGLCVGGALFALTRGELEGSGNVVSEQRPAAGVSRVTIEGPGRLIIEQGEAEGLTITTDDNILEKIETEIDGDELTISYERTGFTTLSRIRPTDEILFELAVRDLAQIEIDGSADVELDGLQGDRLELIINGAGDAFLMGLRLDALAVNVNGASTVDLAGTVDRQEVELNGAVNYRAANLASREVIIEVNGDADATLRVSDTLDVDINGVGLVEYIGDPAITQDISGSGELRPIAGGTPADEATPVATPAATPNGASRPTPTPRPLRSPTLEAS